MSDPMRIVWDALEARGYGPRGQPHDFRARCPGHDGDNPTALHVWDRGDGAASLWCFSHGCSTEEIVERISLRMRDLFPVQLQSRSTRLQTARREDFTGNARTLANLLLAMDRLGLRWSSALWLDECPNCEWPWAQISLDSIGEPRAYCQRGCNLRIVSEALADRVAHHRRRSQ